MIYTRRIPRTLIAIRRAAESAASESLSSGQTARAARATSRLAAALLRSGTSRTQAIRCAHRASGLLDWDGCAS